MTQRYSRRAACGIAAGSLAAMALPLPTRAAAPWPERPLKLIVPFAAGGGSDLIARSIGQKLTEYWGQPVVVENRPGASGWLGLQAVAKAPADGYTILLTISNPVYAKSLYASLPFDIDADFTPVSMLGHTALGLAVAPSFPARTVEEYIAQARKPGNKLSYASFGQGTTAHVFGETLNLAAKLNVVHVPYKGVAPIVQELLGEQVPSAWLDSATLAPLQAAGKVRTLAVTGTARASSLPGVPTFQELGYKGFEPVGFFMALAPTGTPATVVRKLSDGMARAIKQDGVGTRMRDLGQEPGGSTPEELKRTMKELAETMDRAIKAAGIKVES